MAAADCVILALQHYDQGPEWQALQDNANLVYVIIYGAEAVVKVAGLGWVNYLRSSWHQLDLLVVLLSLLSLLFAAFSATQLRALVLFRFQRLLRMLKLVRLLRKLGDISRLLDTFAAAVLPMLHIAGLVFVIFFGFAFLGVLLFGEVPHGEALNSHANFESWPMAMLLLLS
ncbi:sodium channel 60E [Haematococcus lacustris]|uniref:Sodium channel 60E n=1 Tax=Haematococcus lacustris TaxID=44745 RepID=A0A699ZJH1_HAELA|nr:sodium channel 60E [Haematococcus lacustris]